jgi:hypothetical protein
MKAQKSRSLLWVGCVVFAVVAVCAWRVYLGNGLAYSDILALFGRDQSIAASGFRMMVALAVALGTEGFVAGAIIWAFWGNRDSTMDRLGRVLFVAAIVDVASYAAARGL